MIVWSWLLAVSVLTDEVFRLFPLQLNVQYYAKVPHNLDLHNCAWSIRPNQISVDLKRKMDKTRGAGFVHQPASLLCIREGLGESAGEQRKPCEEGACQNISMWPAGMRRVGLPQQRSEEIRLWYIEEVRCGRCHQDVFGEIKRLAELSNTFNVVRKIIISLRCRKVQEDEIRQVKTQRKSLKVILGYFPPVVSE